MASDDSRNVPFQEKSHNSTRANWSGVRLFLIVFGLSAVVSFVVGMWNGVLSLSWPATNGKVLSSGIQVDEEGFYGASVTYGYEVAGGHYEGHNVHVSEMHSGSGQVHAQATVKNYPAGAAIVVHYNPVFPGQAVLEPGPNWGDLWLLGIAGFMLYLGFFAKHQSENPDVRQAGRTTVVD